MGLSGFQLCTSNRMERLADALAEVLRRPLTNPLAPETIVVPNGGVARWLSFQLAERLGVWANFRFPYPDHFLSDAVSAVLPDAPGPAPFRREILLWRVLRHLGARVRDPGFEEVRTYLGTDDDGGWKRLELARVVAEVFELYQVFRPDVLRNWEAGEGRGWQPELWRGLAAEHPGADQASRLRLLLERSVAGGSAPPVGSLPERVSVFGVATLAPVRLEALAALARWTEVCLFAVNPSRLFWGDLVSDREAARLAAEASERGVPVEELHLERGHPLLASAGRLGREFFAHALSLPGVVEQENFEEPGEGSLLRCLQSDILNLVDRGPASKDGAARRMLSPGDRSVQLQSCHSPAREVEIVHDHLLELFRTVEGLEPGDVLVATPDIETYAPLVEAVFGGVTDPLRRIPYSLADRSALAQGHLVDAFARLLGLVGTRLPLSGVLDLLESPAVQRRFGFLPGDLDWVRRWLAATRVRWGIDAGHRAAAGVPAFEENSWRAAFRRLVLGYALPEGAQTPFRGILPCDGAEGGEAAVLGRLVEFGERLFAASEDLQRPRTLGRWSDALTRALEGFFAHGEEEEREAQSLRKAFADLREAEAASGIAEPLGLKAVRSHLQRAFEGPGPGTGYLLGRVTVCALRPLRSVPFRVVCVLGLNDRGFPRADRRPGFDLLARERRPGDPSLRDEDRYLFLETLLSARDRLYLSYVGQSAEDNTAMQPSVLVSELLDAVAEGFIHPDGELPGALVTRHRLQAFSPAYFEAGEETEGDEVGAPLFSYSAEDLEGLRARRAPQEPPAPFVREPLPEPGPEWRSVGVDRLAAFLANPARHFLTRRLGVWLEQRAGEVEDREPFAVEGLDRYQVQQELLERGLGGRDLQEELPLLRARGVLPPGRVGEVAFEKLRADVVDLISRLRPHAAGGPLEPLTVGLDLELTGGRFRIEGQLGRIHPAGLLRYRCAKLKAKDLARAWVEHLVWNVASPPGIVRETVVVGLDRSWRFAPLGDAEASLASLVAAYWRGCSEPLRVFPESSLEYAKRVVDTGDEGALGAARKKWVTTDPRHGVGEDRDPYFARCFGAVDPLGDDFPELALRLFVPLLGAGGKL